MPKPMRTREEVARAHDIFSALMTMDGLEHALGPNADSMMFIQKVLCWVLQHPVGKEFGTLVDMLEEIALRHGFVWEDRKDEVVH